MKPFHSTFTLFCIAEATEGEKRRVEISITPVIASWFGFDMKRFSLYLLLCSASQKLEKVKN
jgi:hypothetical protein